MGFAGGGRVGGGLMKQLEEAVRGDGGVHYLVCGDGFTVPTCVNTCQILQFKYM